jgi:cell division control protein 6
LAQLEKKVLRKGKAKTRRRMTVLVVDELDQLLTKLQGGSGNGAGGRKQGGGQDLLYQLFELPCKPNSSFVLIGIANSIDLTDRFLPRLRHRNCEPQLVVFPPYQYGALLAVLVRSLCT